MMNPPKFYFDLLKKEMQEHVVLSLKIRKELKEWNMNDIHTFQSNLEEVCKSSVSEKWIYTHFKNDNEKLPRIDVLNLLSVYCGYKDWEDFKFNKSVNSPSKRNKNYWWFSLLLLPFIIASLYWVAKPNETIIMFRDAYTLSLIKTDQLQFKLSTGEAPSFIKNDNYHLKLTGGNNDASDSLFIKGPYFKRSFITVNKILSNDSIWIDLYPDDYPLMLNFYSRSSSDDWEKRQQELDAVLHNEAKIFQVHPKFNGIEILNKTEFIDRLTLPTNTIKNLEILHIEYKHDQIFKLRFLQKMVDHE